MSNYCDEPFYQQNIYTNTYSLWENSAYYDINNLSPQNFSSSWHRGNDEDFETRYTSGPTEGEAPEPPDRRNRRTVTRDALYKDPELFYQHVAENESTPSPAEWSNLNRQRAGVESEEGPSGKNKAKIVRTNRIQKKLDKMLTKPVKMCKAESMMQKMGWHGSAFSRGGTGIVDPIGTSAVFATKNQSFNQLQLKPTSIPVENKDHFAMNALLHIYEFVKNNSEIELVFDRKLYKEERQRIHNIVELMLNVDGLALMDFETAGQMELVLQICDVNCYILQTQCEGEHSDCQIVIYKEAPAHVYMIIPDDLRDDPATPAIVPATTPDEPSDTEVEEETNPFLRSITRNLKKSKDEKTQKIIEKLPPENRLTEKIIEFFTEFTQKKEYSQFKFLGPFNEEEWEGIRQFMEKAAQHLNKEPCQYKDIFDKIRFEIGEDITGNTVINKIPK